MEGKKMIDILVSAMNTYCKSKSIDPDNDIITNKVINTYKCRAEEFLSEFSQGTFESSWKLNFRLGLVMNNMFHEYDRQIYFYDIDGKSDYYLWKVFKDDNSKVYKYEPLIFQGAYLHSTTENGIVPKQYDRVVINPIYLFAALLKFSVFDENVNELPKKMGRSYKEYALAYIFDLYAKGSCVPMNLSEGGLAKKELEKIGENKEITPDSFYRAVKEIIIDKKYDLNKIRDLEAISRDWYNAVVLLSDNSENMKEYLSKKGLQ